MRETTAVNSVGKSIGKIIVILFASLAVDRKKIAVEPGGFSEKSFETLTQSAFVLRRTSRARRTVAGVPAVDERTSGALAATVGPTVGGQFFHFT